MKKCIFLSLLVPIFFSCTSLQQDVNIEQVSFSEDVLIFEERFSKIDADFLIPNVDLNEQLQKEQKIDDFIAEIQEASADLSLQKSARARLFALEGKAQLVAGRKGKAKSLYESSVSAYKGDAHAAILLSRISPSENPTEIESKSSEVSDKSLLILESALNLYKCKRYNDSVAKFDEAFLNLAPFYRESYGKIRDMAWNLRSVDSQSVISDILPLKEINVLQMLFIAREKSDFLYNFLNGKRGDKDLFSKVSASGLLNPVSKPLDEKNAVSSSDRVSKYIAARFLWNLFVAKNPNTSATKYSSRLSRSPVFDVAADNPDFDAILGCVENEFMSLDDGKNFAGERSVPAIEFDGFLEKLK